MAIKKLNKLKGRKLDELFNVIFEQYKNLVYYVAIQIIKLPYLAEEITNDAFLSLFLHWNTIIDYSKIKPYLTSTAKRIAYKTLKDYEEENKIFDSKLDVENVNNFEKDIAPNDYRNLINKFKDYLTEEELDLLILRYYFDYKVKEIANEKGLNRFTVSSKINRGLKKIKQYYQNSESKNKNG